MRICPRCTELFPDDAAYCPLCGATLRRSTDRYLGKVIASRYRLTRRLGQGGMSVVYLATHVVIERQSAIKILRHDLGLSPSHRERFLREARAVNRINHRNIVEITDVGESDGIAYLVMEYVKGDSLLSLLRAGAMPWLRAAKIAIQIASALARAHQVGVIHRDLKPENVMILPQFDEDAVKLMDFGIAKMVDLPSLTFSEQLFGTPGYIAPEYVEGLPIDARCDVYALGVLLYEMTTARLPYDGKGHADLLLMPLTSSPVPPSSRVPGLPGDLEALILRMLSRRPDDRPHDAFAVHDVLLDIVRRHGGGGPPPEVASRARPSEPAPEPRDPIETRVDAREDGAAHSGEPGPLSAPPSQDRWRRARAGLDDLHERLAREEERRSIDPATMSRAHDLARHAGELMARCERTSRAAAEQQLEVDRLESLAREFRARLGRAIDVLVRDRSRERAHLEAMRVRTGTIARGSRPDDEARVWEKAALDTEGAHTRQVIADLTFQIDALQAQLDRKNEELDLAFVAASGALEGSVTALRHLAGELARTIDEGAALVPRRGR